MWNWHQGKVALEYLFFTGQVAAARRVNFERLYDTVGAHKLRGPNDLVFDKSGGFWFTDYGKDMERTRDRSGLYYARPDGSKVVEVYYGSATGVPLARLIQEKLLAVTVNPARQTARSLKHVFKLAAAFSSWDETISVHARRPSSARSSSTWLVLRTANTV